MKRWPGRIVAGLLAVAVVGLSAAAWYAAARPTTLRIAVAKDGDDIRLLGAAAQILKRDGAPVRVKLIPTPDPKAAAAALDSSQADMAVVRSDIAVPADGETVAVLRREVALIIARQGSGIVDLAGLAGRDLAIVGAPGPDGALLDSILQHYEIPAHRVARRSVERTSLMDVMAMRGVDAVFVVAPVTSPVLADVVRSVTTAGGGTPAFVPIAEAEAMSLRRPAIEPAEVVRGAFGGSPPKPVEAVPTLAVTWRLMAHQTLDDGLVAEVTRRLFNMRSDLGRTLPAADLMETPDLDKGARLPVHPGAADFFEDEELTFMDRYGDWIYVAAMLLGFGASAVAAIVTRMRSRVHRHAQRIEHLLSLVARARAASSVEDLDAIEAEADAVVAETLTAAADPPDASRLAALSFALDQVRHAVGERRRLLHPRDVAPPEIAWRSAP